MSVATFPIPQSVRALALSRRRGARAASGKAFALSGARGGIIGRMELGLYAVLFFSIVFMASSFLQLLS